MTGIREANARVTVDASSVRDDAFATDGLAVRVRRGIGALSLNAAVRIVGQLAIVPVAMTGWGAQRYGEWIVLTGIVAFLRLSDLGLQTHVVNRLCALYSTERRTELQRVLHSALRVQIPLVGTLFLLLCLGLALVPFDSLLSLRTLGGIEAGAVAVLLAVELLFWVPMGVVAGVYRATGQLARGAMTGSIQAAGQVALTLALIAGGQSFVLIALARVVVAAAVCSWILVDLRRLYPWLHISSTRGEWREGVAMIPPGLLFLLFPLADFLSTQVSLLALQKIADGELVSHFATHRTAVNLAMMASGLVINAVWPELTALHARGTYNELGRVQRSLVLRHTWLVGGITFVMLPFLPWVYSSWTAGRLAIDSWTLGFLIARVILWGFWNACMTVLQATNRHRVAAVTVLASAAAGAIFVVLLVPRFGMRGAAAALLLGDLCFSAWLVPLLAAREAGDRLTAVTRDVGRALVPSLGVPVAFGAAAWWLFPEGSVRDLCMPILAVALGLFATCRQFSMSPRNLIAHTWSVARMGVFVLGSATGRR